MKYLFTILFLLFQADLKAQEKQLNATTVYIKSMIYVKSIDIAQKSLDEISSSNDLTYFVDLPQIVDSIVFSADILLDLAETFPPPNYQYLSYFGRGFSQEQAQEFQSFEAGILLTFAFPSNQLVDGVQMSSLVSYQIAERAKGYIWDVDTREVFTPMLWMHKRIESWQNEIPNINSNIIIQASKQNGIATLRTYGMNKFNLPDLSIVDFDWKYKHYLSEVLGLVSQYLFEGFTNTIENKINVEFDKLSESSFKVKFMQSLKLNSVNQFPIVLRLENLANSLIKNSILELSFQDYPGDDIFEKQKNMLDQLFELEISYSLVKPNNELEKASQLAKSELPKVKTIFNDKLDTIQQILLKFPLISEDGSTELIWGKVVQWDENQIQIKLEFDSVKMPDLIKGSKLSILQKNVVDYAIYFTDGFVKGNTTGKLIQQMQL
jgi:hypothetical protein